jgi:hypothetical protein
VGHNDTLREKMTRVVDILDHCQKKMNTGYLSAYPEKMFDMYEELFEAWSPYYTIHKVCTRTEFHPTCCVDLERSPGEVTSCMISLLL